MRHICSAIAILSWLSPLVGVTNESPVPNELLGAVIEMLPPMLGAAKATLSPTSTDGAATCTRLPSPAVNCAPSPM